MLGPDQLQTLRAASCIVKVTKVITECLRIYRVLDIQILRITVDRMHGGVISHECLLFHQYLPNNILLRLLQTPYLLITLQYLIHIQLLPRLLPQPLHLINIDPLQFRLLIIEFILINPVDLEPFHTKLIINSTSEETV